jgi:hypothetical protein
MATVWRPSEVICLVANDSEILTTGRRYDTFLAHNSKDKVLVEELARHLQREGVSSFLDSREIMPGALWQQGLDRGLRESRTCAVCIGPAGLTDWTLAEVRIAIDRNHRDASYTVIPILLPGAEALEHYSLSSFLLQFQAVDFRSSFEEVGLKRLVAAIRSAGSPAAQLTSEPELHAPPVQAGAAAMQRLSPDRIVETSHSQQALVELERLRLRRVLRAPADAREEVKRLADRIETGDLRYAGPSVKAQVLQLAARRHATVETLELGRQFRDALLRADPTASTVVIDALLLKAEGDIDASLRSLRDVDEPDAHDVFFVILNEAHGDALSIEWYENQERRDDPDFFTGLGWRNLAFTLARLDRWEEAAARLANAAKHRRESADFSLTEGIVNAGLLLPVEYRRLLLEMNLLPSESLEGPEADRRRATAIACFRRVEEMLAGVDPEGAFVARERSLGLRLAHTDPQERRSAVAEVERDLQAQSTSQAVRLIPLADQFQISFDTDRFWKHLNLQAKIDRLNDRELHVQYLLAKSKLSSQDFYAFLENEEPRLAGLFPRGKTAMDKIEALLRDEQTARARAQLERDQDEIGEDDRRRISIILDAQEGKDPRAELEKLYESTCSLLDLQNLANYLRKAKDWKALKPLLAELFRRERNLHNLLCLAECMEHSPDGADEEILDLLNSNPDLAARDLDLLGAKAHALLHLGRMAEARALNDQLLVQRKHPRDVDRDINLALQSGDWERLPGIVEREWLRREEHGARELIRLASLAAETDATASRAFELLKLAAEKGSGDPYVLAQAAGLTYRLGREDEQPSAWLAKAVELSPEGGPVTTVELRELVEEWMPKHQEHRRNAEELWLRGEAPLHLVAASLNTPLSILLIDLPRRNERTQDGRRRTIIPIMSGARRPIVLQSEWCVGFDISSLMVLAHLGVLKEALHSFRRTFLPPDTMVVLLKERNQIRFHQPSLVKRAEEIRRLIDRGHLRIMEALPEPPEWLAQEVGRDFAQLLAAARKDRGYVVRPRPIHKMGSFLNEEADLRDEDSLTLSTLELEQLLYESRALDTETHEKALQYLRFQDRGTEIRAGASVLAGPIYLDDLALTYLLGAGLLPVLEEGRLDFRVHPSVREEQMALIENEHERQRLEKDLEAVRVTLRDSLQEGAAEFLPRRGSTEEEEKRVLEASPTLGELMQDFGSCDAVAIDDRYSQRFGRMTDRAARERPVIGVVDILRHLEVQGVITRVRRFVLLHKLRYSGFAFIPIEPDELLSDLHTVQWKDDGSVVESVELRTLRQTLARIRSLEMLATKEAPFVEQLRYASILAIRQIWADEAIAAERVVWMTNWLWSHVSPFPGAWLREGKAELEQALVHHIALLLMPLSISTERLAAFLGWVQERVLEPLFPAHGGILEHLASQIGEQIESWSTRFAGQDKDGTAG